MSGATRRMRDPGREPREAGERIERAREDLDSQGREALAALSGVVGERAIALELDDGRLFSPRHPFVARRSELPHERLRAHARATLSLLATLAEHGWMLSDGDPQNFAWDSGGALLIDWGAPVRRTPPNAPWVGLRQFCELALYPLTLSRRTGVSPARWLRAYPEGVDARTARDVLGALRTLRTPLVVAALLALTGRTSKAAASPPRIDTAGRRGDALAWTLRRLKRALDALGAPRRRWDRAGAWARHEPRDSYAQQALSARNAAVRSIAERTRARRVLDLGAHHGALLETVCQAYAPEHAVALDIDPGCASALCERFSDAPVTVLESDLMDERSGEALTERLGTFGASLTLACGLVHHLALANGDGLERAARALTRCAGRERGAVLIVEWIPEDDAQLRSLYDHAHHRSPHLATYSKTRLAEALGKGWRFETRAIEQSSRSLLVCERC